MLQCLSFQWSIAQRRGHNQGQLHSKDHFTIMIYVLMILRAIRAPVYGLSLFPVLDQTVLMSFLCSAMHR